MISGSASMVDMFDAEWALSSYDICYEAHIRARMICKRLCFVIDGV